MERFAAESIEAQRDQQIRAAIKANVPWTTLAEEYGMTLEQIIKASERMGLTQTARSKDDLLDSRKEGHRG